MSTDIVIREDVKAELATEAKSRREIMGELARLAVTDAEGLDLAGEGVKMVKGWWKDLEEKRTAVTKPINAALKEVNGWFKPVQKEIEQCEATLKAKIGAYTLAQQEAARAAMRAASVAVQAGDTAGAASYIGAMVPAAAPTGVSVRAVWDYEVTDPAAVPRELCSPDDALIRALFPKDVREGTEPTIPGVRVFVRGQVAVRA